MDREERNKHSNKKHRIRRRAHGRLDEASGAGRGRKAARRTRAGGVNWDNKRGKGQYFTHGNPFNNVPFARWAKQAGLPDTRILEPFAGSNSLVTLLDHMGHCRHAASYDIAPADIAVQQRDTLSQFPTGFDVCITNPPWLAKNSATARGLPYPNCVYDDLYKYALEKCLNHCGYVASLVPESFITANLFQDRLQDFISLTYDMFADTNHPVGLALFVPNDVNDVNIWSGARRVGLLSSLKKLKPRQQNAGISVRFNDPHGNVGLIALDNTKEASIRFCEVDELADYQVKQTGRHITKLNVEGGIRIREWNQLITEFREQTCDVLMTCYKGIRKDGKYRRRCDWGLARGIIHHVG